MTKVLKNSPLREVITTISWGADPTHPDSPLEDKEAEEFFNFRERLTSKMSDIDYPRSQIVTPPNTPLWRKAPNIRFFQNKEGMGNTIYQMGPEVLSINARPPYDTWEGLLPTIENGINILLDELPGQKKFYTSIRYINAFTQQFYKEKSLLQFVNEDLKFKISIPEFLKDDASPELSVTPELKFVVPLKAAFLTFFIFYSILDGENVYILDFFMNKKLYSNISAATIIEQLKEEHDYLHKMFLEMTVSLIETFNK